MLGHVLKDLRSKCYRVRFVYSRQAKVSASLMNGNQRELTAHSLTLCCLHEKTSQRFSVVQSTKNDNGVLQLVRNSAVRIRSTVENGFLLLKYV